MLFKQSQNRSNPQQAKQKRRQAYRQPRARTTNRKLSLRNSNASRPLRSQDKTKATNSLSHTRLRNNSTSPLNKASKRYRLHTIISHPEHKTNNLEPQIRVSNSPNFLKFKISPVRLFLHQYHRNNNKAWDSNKCKTNNSEDKIKVSNSPNFLKLKINTARLFLRQYHRNNNKAWDSSKCKINNLECKIKVSNSNLSNHKKQKQIPVTLGNRASYGTSSRRTSIPCLF